MEQGAASFSSTLSLEEKLLAAALSISHKAEVSRLHPFVLLPSEKPGRSTLSANGQGGQNAVSRAKAR